MSSTITPTFTAGGLISGLDTNSIVDKLTQLAAQPITDLKKRQTAFQSQISALGDIAARLSSLQDATAALGDTGALGVQTTTTNTAFTATPSASSPAGTYQIEVKALASPAQARSAAFASATAPVKGGTLALNVQGKAYNVTIADGAALSDVALAIRQSGAPVSASVLNDGTNSYLSITNRATGFPLTGVAADALSITETSTGALGQALGASIISPAANASFVVDGLTFKRTSNTVSDALPGTTLVLKGISSAGPETLSLDADAKTTGANVQKFVDAFNRVMSLVQSQLAVSKDTDRQSTLAGSALIRGLQQSLNHLVTTKVGTTSVSTLAELGVQTNRDGSLALDQTKLAAAMARDPIGVNGLFQDATSGLSTQVKALVDVQTNSAKGLLVQNKKTLTQRIAQLDDQVDALQARNDAYRAQLVQQFSAMESIISGAKATGNFLTSQENAKK
jgi:flagellar hook-associated protein 2